MYPTLFNSKRGKQNNNNRSVATELLTTVKKMV